MSSIGTLTTNFVSSQENAISFGLGGITGILYQLLLHLDVDHIGQTKTNIFMKLVANSAVRLSSVAFMLGFAMQLGDSTDNNKLPIVLAGFLLHKFAILGVFMSAKK